MTIHQDIDLYANLLDAGQAVVHALRPGRHAWVQVARGAVTLDGNTLKAGDGPAVSGETRLEIQAVQKAEFLLFDLA